MNTLIIENKDNYTVIELNNGKVNALNTEILSELAETVSELNNDKSCKGLLLQGRPDCFSAGLDVVTLATSTKENYESFWIAYHKMLQALVNFSKPFVCAITGYAPAGATILTLCADYRVMAKGEKHVIGMNEFNMHLQIPEMLCDIYAYYLGEPKAWAAVQNAKLYNSDEALELGLINESVAVENVIPHAEKQLKHLINIYQNVFSLSKRYFRKGLLEIVNKDINPFVEDCLKQLEDPMVQQMANMFLKNLKSK